MLRHSRFKSNLSLSQKRTNFDKALECAKGYDDWRQIILYILNNQKGVTQFDLLNHYLGMMDNINNEYLDKVCYYIDNYLNCADSLPASLILIKYILKFSTNSTLVKCEKQFKNSIKKYGLLEKQSQILEQGVNEKSKHYLQYIELGIEVLPIIYTRCRIMLNQATINTILKWLCIIPSQSIEIILSIGKFCDWIVNTRSGKDLSQQLRIQSTRQLLLAVLDCYQKNYVHKNNLVFFFEVIDSTLLYRAIKKKSQKFLQKKFNVYLNLWITLLELGGSSKLIKFIYEISNLYKASQQYDFLLQIYERLILPVIIKRIKFSRTAQQQIQQLTTFYMNTLFTNIPNKVESIEAILENYNRLDTDYKVFWSNMIGKIIKSSEDIKIQKQYEQFCRKQGVNLINNEDFLRLKQIQAKILKPVVIDQKIVISDSIKIQKYREPSIPFSVIPFDTYQIRGKKYNFMLNIQTGLNILLNTTKLALFINKISFIIQKSTQKILIAVLFIFSKMQQNKASQIYLWVQKILQIPHDQTHLSSVDKFIKYVLDNLNTLLLYQQERLNEFCELIKIQANYSPCTSCIYYEEDDMIDMNYLELAYGQGLQQQLKNYRNCKKCKKHYLSTGNLLILPNIMFVFYDHTSDKDAKYFKINHKYQQHILKLIQFSVIKNQNFKNHIFWRQMNLKVWLYFDGQSTQQIESNNIQQIIQKQLGQNALPTVAVYSR